MDARARALGLLACNRGLVTPAALRDLVARGGPGAPLADLLVRGGLLQPAALTALLRDLAQVAFSCERCGLQLTLDHLAGSEHLLCPRCGGALSLGGPPERAASLARPARPTTDRAPAAPAPRPPADDLGRYVSEDLTGSASSPRSPRESSRSSSRDSSRDSSWTAAAGPPARPPGDTRTGSERLGCEGRRLGPYVIERELGRGSNGVVYLARRPGTDTPLALKILRDADLADEETIKRFELEAAVSQKLRHPGIIAVFDAGRDGETRYFVMEFAPGLTLKERLVRGPLPPPEAARVLHELASAMAVAHDAGVIHRDLKPANVILAEDTGRARVTDFGLARDRTLLRSMTRSGDVIGTPFYMAPEQLRGEKTLDHRVDIYALGVVIYECLTGRRPFIAETFIQLVEAVTRGEPTSPSAVAPDLPRPLEAVVLKAMARDPGDRYATCHELVADLERLAAGKRPRAPLPSRRAGPGGPRPGAARLAVAAAATALVGGLLAVGLMALASPEAPGQGASTATGDGRPAGPGQPSRSKDLRALRRELEEALAPGRPPAETRAALERLLPDAWEPEVQRRVQAELGRARVHEVLARLAGASDAEAAALLRRAQQVAGGEAALTREVALAEGHQHARRGRFEQAARALEPAAADPGALGLQARWRLGFVLEKLGRGDEAHAAYSSAGADTGADAGAAGGASPVGPCARAATKRLEGDLAAAELSARGAYERDHASLPALLELARIRLERGDLAGADAVIERARAATADEPEVHVLSARLKLREGKLASAEQSVARALALTSGAPDPDALVLRAQAALRAAPPRADDAGRDLDDALARAPTHLEGLLWRGALRQSRGDAPAAREDWRRAWSADQARCERLGAHLLDDAREAFRRAVGLEEAAPRPAAQPKPPGGPAPVFVDPTTALEELAGLLSSSPDSDLSREVEAILEARTRPLGDMVRDDLRQALVTAARGRPWRDVAFPLRRVTHFMAGDAAALLEQARIHAARDRTREAGQALDALEAAGVITHELARLRADVALRAGAPGHALQAYEALAAADPDGVEGRCAAAAAHLLQGSVKEARAAAERALEVEPEHTPSLIVRALALQQLGEARLAGQAIQAARAREGHLDSRLGALTFVMESDRLLRVLGLTDAELTDHVLFDIYDRPYAREVAAECLLAAPAPAPRTLELAAALLSRARSIEPDRPGNHLAMARHALLAGRGRDDVLSEWRRARALSSAATPPPADRERFRTRFGGADVEALIGR